MAKAKRRRSSKRERKSMSTERCLATGIVYPTSIWGKFILRFTKLRLYPPSSILFRASPDLAPTFLTDLKPCDEKIELGEIFIF